MFLSAPTGSVSGGGEEPAEQIEHGWNGDDGEDKAGKNKLVGYRLVASGSFGQYRRGGNGGDSAL